MKKWLHVLLILILIVVGISIGLSSLYFIPAPLPQWLEDNPIALFLYTTTIGKNIYIAVSLVIGYLLVVYALYIVEKIDPTPIRPRKRVTYYDDEE